MSDAARRMRKYRARKRLIRTLSEARDLGVNIDQAIADWRKKAPHTAAQVDTLTRPLELEHDPPDR
jgi:hypothetical protein